MQMKRFTLPRLYGWILLTVLVFIDTFLDVLRGGQGNPLWKPVIDIIGIEYTPILVPLVIILFYVVVKVGGWIIFKVDKLPQSEEILLTCLVLAFAVYDIWVISVDFLNFKLIQSHIHMIPILIVVALGYALWAEFMIKRSKET